MEIQYLNNLFEYYQKNFRIKSLLVISGQREVYVGMSLCDKLNEEVIIKLTTGADPTQIPRIVRETQLLGRIDSDLFVKVHYMTFISQEMIDEFADQNEILASEHNLLPFLLTLEEKVDHVLWDKIKVLYPTEVDFVKFFETLASALEIMSSNKIIHRDLKPDNILITKNGQPKIIDLGAAKSLHQDDEKLTQTGNIAPLTIQYAAPEQFVIGGDVSYKSDQFSIGVILYNLFTGQFPYGRKSEIGGSGIVNNFKHLTPKSVNELNSNISGNLSNVIQKMIAAKPFKRFRTNKLLLAAIKEINKQ